MLRNWLLRYLCGLPIEEADRRVDVQLLRVAEKEKSFTEQREWFYTVLQAKDEEIKRLTNLMLQEHGIIRTVPTSNSNEKMVPLNKRMSWKEKQEELQRADAKAAADKVKKQWESKRAPEPDIESRA